MDTPITLLDILQQHQVTTFMAAAIVLVVIIFCAWFFNRRIQKHDALIAKPLCLTADQEKQVSVRHHHKPTENCVRYSPQHLRTNRNHSCSGLNKWLHDWGKTPRTSRSRPLRRGSSASRSM